MNSKKRCAPSLKLSKAQTPMLLRQKHWEKARDVAFELERELLEAEAEARAMEEKQKLKENQLSQLEDQVALMEAQIDSVFAGRREQQEELKARLNELFKRRKRRPKRPQEQMTEEEVFLEKLEDKLDEIAAAQEQEFSSLEEHDADKVKQLEELREKVDTAESDKMAAQDQQFEEEARREIEDIDSWLQDECANELADFNKKVEGKAEEVPGIKAEHESRLSALRAKHAQKRKDALAKIDARRKKRMQDVEFEEAKKNEERDLALAAAKKVALMKEQELAEIEAKAKGARRKKSIRLKLRLMRRVLRGTAKTMRSLPKEELFSRSAARRARLLWKLRPRKKRKNFGRSRRAKRQRRMLRSLKQNREKMQLNARPKRRYEEDIKKKMEKIREDAENKRIALEVKLREEKNKRAKLQERLRRKRANAQKKKDDLKAAKRKEAEEVEARLRAEEDKMRERQAEEIKEIENARIEVLLDDKHAESLAAGVNAWRKRRIWNAMSSTSRQRK